MANVSILCGNCTCMVTLPQREDYQLNLIHWPLCQIFCQNLNMLNAKEGKNPEKRWSDKTCVRCDLFDLLVLTMLFFMRNVIIHVIYRSNCTCCTCTIGMTMNDLIQGRAALMFRHNTNEKLWSATCHIYLLNGPSFLYMLYDSPLLEKNSIELLMEDVDILRWSQGVVTDIFSESKLRLLNL